MNGERPAEAPGEAGAYEPVTKADALTAMEAAYVGVTTVLDRLEPDDFLAPTLCSAWVVSDIAFHLMLDAQRALIALVTPSDAPPDVDYVTYWRPWSSEDADAIAHARYVRVASSAYASPESLVAHRRVTAEASVRAAAAAEERACISTQGHSMTVPDFLATLAVEATIHHLDLVAHLRDAPVPDARSLALVRRTLDGLAGTHVDAWDDITYALKGTGREPLTTKERARLGAPADAFPLFS